jgi:hypothetical protein
MKRVFHIAVVVFAGAIGFGASYVAYSQRLVDDPEVYKNIVTVKGHVEWGRKRGEPMVGSGAYLVFQRDGCDKCLVATYADANGDYKILIGRGRYKLIAYNPSGPSYDLLAPGQSRHVDAVPRLQETQFDIKLVAPSER